MAGFESFPTPGDSQELSREQDGLPPEEYFQENYGISKQVAAQEVMWGSYTGTVGQMLMDEKCPVGGQVRTAFRNEGFEGVERTFSLFRQIDPRFVVDFKGQNVANLKKKTILS